MILNVTDRYYHNRAAKNSAAPQTTSSPKETQAESPPGPSAPLGGPPELPDFMRGVRVFFYNLAASERRTLARHLVTYPFTGGDNCQVFIFPMVLEGIVCRRRKFVASKGP